MDVKKGVCRAPKTGSLGLKIRQTNSAFCYCSRVVTYAFYGCSRVVMRLTVFNSGVRMDCNMFVSMLELQSFDNISVLGPFIHYRNTKIYI